VTQSLLQRDVVNELEAHHEFRSVYTSGAGSDFAAALEQAQIASKRWRNQLFSAESKAAAAKELDTDLKRQHADAG
jgi:hypothetical protein